MDSKCLYHPHLNNTICENATHDFVLNTFLSSRECCDAENELLYLNNLREASEIYHRKTVICFCASEKLVNMQKLFLDEDAWHNMINYLQRKRDKYIVFAASRTISAIMYNFPQSIFQTRLTSLVENMLKMPTDESTVNSLELLISLLYYSRNIAHNGSECKCVNEIVYVKSLPEDLFSCLCVTLSLHWHSFVDNFLKVGNRNIVDFLQLWKLLSEKNLNQELSSAFLNENFAVDFLPKLFKLPVCALRIYVDIISQTFCSSLKSGSWNCFDINALEENVTSAISGGCLQLVPVCDMVSTFCTSSCRNKSISQVELPKLNSISKKVIFIAFNLLAEFTNTLSLCEVLDKVFEFISIQSDTQKPGSTYCWMIDSFIEYDDLLFGIMLATLRMYCKLKEQDRRLQVKNTSVDLYMKEFNPHKVFIKFLQQIGWDHNELLSFLLSDETCCLLYLLQYLKLLLAEQSLFIESHEFLFAEKCEQELTFENDLANLQKGVLPKRNCSSPKCPLDLHNKLLVSYSSSSSSEDEPDPIAKDSNEDEMESFIKKSASTTISILMNLREGIQKLVDIKEFPYEVQPLLNLLRTCSDICRLFK